MSIYRYGITYFKFTANYCLKKCKKIWKQCQLYYGSFLKYHGSFTYRLLEKIAYIQSIEVNIYHKNNVTVQIQMLIFIFKMYTIYWMANSSDYPIPIQTMSYIIPTTSNVIQTCTKIKSNLIYFKRQSRKK